MSSNIGNEISPFKVLNENDVLFKQGERAQFVYVVAEGSLVCLKENNKRLTPVLYAQKRSIIGMESLADPGRVYSYSAIAKERVEVVPIALSLIEGFFQSSPELMLDLLKTLAEKITHTTEVLVEHRIVDEKLYTGDLFSDEEEVRYRKLLS